MISLFMRACLWCGAWVHQRQRKQVLLTGHRLVVSTKKNEKTNTGHLNLCRALS